MLNILINEQNTADILDELKRHIAFVDITNKLLQARRCPIVILRLVQFLHMKYCITNNSQKLFSKVRADLLSIKQDHLEKTQNQHQTRSQKAVLSFADIINLSFEKIGHVRFQSLSSCNRN